MPKSLLLADDSVTIQQVVEMIFKGEDVTLTVVSDGNEAFSRARAAKPDLILADVGMPGLGGYELCEKVRADAGMRHIPVLLLGGGTPIDPAKAIAVGANGHMPKPFESQKLVDQVKQILANPKAVPAPAAAAPKPSAPPPSRPAAPPSRPPAAPGAPASRPPAPAGNTLQMARPPTVPGMKPVAPVSRPPGAPAAPPRPGAPVPSRPPGAMPPGARPAAQAAPRPAAPAGTRPPSPAGARPPTAKVPPTLGKPPIPQMKSAPPAPREYTERLALPAATNEEIPMEVDEIVEEAPAGAPAPLRAVPAPPAPKQQPALSVVPGARGTPADGGEALLREALSKASREVIEKIAWEVVPELAETIIREELERLMKERGA